MSARTIVKSIQDIMRQDVGVDGEASLATATTTLHALLEALLHAAFVQEPLAPEGAA